MSDVVQCQRPDVDPDDWFAGPDSPKTVRAKRLCLHCPLYWDCREYAIREGVPAGVWGGVDEWTRARLWRQNGGRPTKFLDDIDAAMLPALQARRDHENYDTTHAPREGGEAA
jgi:WhiB family transcriptional regulator, redox-sensing transcriptional regulator